MSTFIRLALIGFVAAGCYAVLAYFVAPPMVAVDPGRYSGGIRLFRDEFDIRFYFERRAKWVADGGLPYDTANAQEYPPLAVLFYSWPRFVTGEFRLYRMIFAAQTSALFGILFGLTAVILRRLGASLWRLALFFLPALIYFSVWRFDILAAVIVAGLGLALLDGMIEAAFVLLVMGVFVKVYPVMYFLPLVMWVASGTIPSASPARIRRGFFAAAALSLAIVGAVALTAGVGGLGDSLLVHVTRKYDVTSLSWVFMRYLPIASLPRWSLVPIIRYALPISLIVLQYGVVIALVLRGKVRSYEAFVRSALLAILPLIAFNRFFSPQFILWITPALLPVADRRELAILVLLDLALFVEFPLLYDTDPYSANFSLVVLLRVGILLWLFALNYRHLRALGAIGPAIEAKK